MTTIADLIDPPAGRLVLVYGPPGAGKTTFLNKLLVHNVLDLERPAIVVSTDREPEAVLEELKRAEPILEKRSKDVKLQFIDAYRGTVGLASGADGFQSASCSDLSGLAITLGKLAKSLDRKDLLVVIDSLTPIYLMNAANALRFVQATLMRYAAEGRRVIMSIDEGCGRHEDLIAMTSLAAAIIRLHSENSQRILEVIKYPGIQPSKFAIASLQAKQLRCRMELTKGTESYQTHYAILKETRVRPELDDWIDILWIQVVLWGGIAWDPLRFPRLLYELSKELESHCLKNSRPFWSDEDRKAIESFAAKFDAHDSKSVYDAFSKAGHGEEHRQWRGLPADSPATRSTLRFRKLESSLCWGLPDIGSPLCFHDCGISAGELNSADKEGCEWEVYEEKCVGTGHGECEIVCTTDRPKEFDESFTKGHK